MVIKIDFRIFMIFYLFDFSLKQVKKKAAFHGMAREHFSGTPPCGHRFILPALSR
jgi:hypothetical protein